MLRGQPRPFGTLLPFAITPQLHLFKRSKIMQVCNTEDYKRHTCTNTVSVLTILKTTPSTSLIMGTEPDTGGCNILLVPEYKPHHSHPGKWAKHQRTHHWIQNHKTPSYMSWVPNGWWNLSVFYSFSVFLLFSFNKWYSNIRFKTPHMLQNCFT